MANQKDAWIWHIPAGSMNIRFQLDGETHNGWAVHTEEDSGHLIQTSVMYILILFAIFINLASVFGLLRGKKMRLILLDGLIRMYKDQQVEAYYDQSLLRSYSIRYHIFISVVVFIGVISIVIPLIVRYL